MERMLQKLAQQLSVYDESSLLALWEKYAGLTSRFEPSKRWEEAAIIFCLIQAVHMKNQLFNYNLAHNMTPGDAGPKKPKGRTDSGLDNLKSFSPDLFAGFSAFNDALAGKKAEEKKHKEKAGRVDDPDLLLSFDEFQDFLSTEEELGSSSEVKQGCKILPFRRDPGQS